MKAVTCPAVPAHGCLAGCTSSCYFRRSLRRSGCVCSMTESILVGDDHFRDFRTERQQYKLSRSCIQSDQLVVDDDVRSVVPRRKAQIPLRRLCDKVRDKFPTKSRTQTMKVRGLFEFPQNLFLVADFHDFVICVGESRRNGIWA